MPNKIETVKMIETTEVPENKLKQSEINESNKENDQKSKQDEPTFKKASTMAHKAAKKTNEDSWSTRSSLHVSKSPLGGIDIKSSAPRLGLSRNSRPKPLHTNIKPQLT